LKILVKYFLNFIRAGAKICL